MAKTIAMIFGAIYLIVGVVGFFPGIGSGLSITPPGTLFGIMQINGLHNLVHIIIGAMGLTANTQARAVMFCRLWGIILLILGVAGFITPNLFGYLPIGGYDTYIHIASAVVLLFGGFVTAAPAPKTA